MDLTVTTESGVPDNQHWLGSAHGTDTGISIMLVGALWVAVFPDGIIPSGVTIGQITSAGATQNMYGPYLQAASDGRTLMAGHLLTAVKCIGKDGATHNVGGSLFWHGRVIEANLPTNHGLDANGKTDVAGRLWYT